jgi:hypothetical protein
MDRTDRMGRIVESLRAASEDLAELSVEVLSEAVREGATRRPDSERILTRARSAVDKAVALLESMDRDRDEEDEVR